VSALVQAHRGDAILAGDVIAHLHSQLVAARRMLAAVLEQGAAIRRRSVQEVVRLAGVLQAEMQMSTVLEAERLRLMNRIAGRVGSSAPETVTLSQLTALMEPDRAAEAHRLSSELKGVLTETQREHHLNRALMAQELAFLDHLLRLTGGAGGYNSGGDHASPRSSAIAGRRRVFDLEA
jgi:hypothetical protein